MAYPVSDPRVVLPDVDGLETACDTEGSGKHVDDGARVAIVSVAWWAADVDPTADPDDVVSFAFPFDQGIREGKPEYTGQGSLFDEGDPNLGLDSWTHLIRWLQRQQLDMHPAAFDCPMMWAGTRMGKADPRWRGVDLRDRVVLDTMVGCREVWPTEPVALKTTAVRLELLRDTPTAKRMGGWEHGIEARDQQILRAHLERIRPKAWYGRDKGGSAHTTGRWDLGDWDTIGVYAALDAELTLRLARRIRTRIEEGRDGRYGAHVFRSGRWLSRELQKARVLYQMEQRGVGFDVARCLQAAAAIRRERDRIARTLPFAVRGVPTVESARRWYFGDGSTDRGDGIHGRYPAYAWTSGAKPKPALDAEIVERMVRDGLPHADDYQRWKQLDDSLSKWYQAYPNATGEDGRLRTVYRQCQVVSGRTSVERINLQAIVSDYQLLSRLPPGVPTIWGCVAARPGHRLWGLDAAQAELRVGARWAPCPTMLDLIRSGADAHGRTAEELFGSNKNHPSWGEHRQVAKRANFSLIFDVGPATFQATLRKYLGLEWTLEECQRVVYGWRDLYPQFRSAVYRAMRSAQERGYVRLINGRLSWFNANDLRADPDFHKAFNRFVQGSLAEWGAEWMIWIEREHPGLLCLWVHDAAYLEVPIGQEWRVEEIAKQGIAIFERMFDVPGGVDRHVVAEPMAP